MKKLYICILFLVNVATSGFATTYYVSTSGTDYPGSDRIDTWGRSWAESWRTIETATRRANAGDTVIVADGIYEEGAIRIDNKIGTKERPLVVKAANRLKAVIQSISCCNAVQIDGCVGVVFDGFEVTFKDPTKTWLFGILTVNSFWVTIKNCYVHDIGSTGIQINDGEYLFVENNIVRSNAKNTGNPNGSGISSFHAKYSPDYQEGDWGIVIRNNICFENVCPFALPGFTSPVDGNGIILDDFRNLQTQFGGGQPGGYYHPVLVENNLVFNNGGRGVHIYHTDNVTVRNNTLYHNNFELSKYSGFGWNGDLNIDESNGAKVYNNIIVMRPSNQRGYASLVWDGTEIHNNLIIGPEGKRQPFQAPVSGTYPTDNKIQPTNNQGYAKFVNATYNVYPFDVLNPQFSRFFGLSSDSPAINAGNNSNRAATDLEGKTRPLGGVVDMGCYEGGGGGGDTQAPSIPTNLTLTNATTSSISFSWTASTDNVGVTGYDVYTNGSYTASTGSTNFVVNGLSANTSYSFTVRAKDAAGNTSGASSALVASTTNPPQGGSNGLKGELFTEFNYGVSGSVNAISGKTPAFTYTARIIDYPSNGASNGANWGTWLGSEGSGAPNESIQTSTLRLSGYIQIESEFDVQGGNGTIEVDFALGSAGYSRLMLNNNQVILDESNWNFSTTGARVSFPGPGYYPIEIIHATGYDVSGIELYSSIGSGINPGRGTSQAATIVPANVLFSQKPDGSTDPSPVAPTNLRTTSVTATSITLAWDAAGGSTAGYQVYRNGTYLSTTAATNMGVNGLSPNTSYTFTVRAENASGVVLGESAPLTVTTTGAGSVPTPTNLRVISKTSTRVHLTWNAAGGNTAGYHIYRNGTYVGTTAALDRMVENLSPNTTYTFTVRAETALGVYLGLSAPLTVTTNSSGRFSTDEVALTTTWGVFPNPGVEGEALSIKPGVFANKNVQITINDMTGKQLMAKKMLFSADDKKLSVQLPKGMYVLRVTDGTTTEQTKLVIH